MDERDETQSLIASARSGDRPAFDRLVELYRPRLRALVSSRWSSRVVVGVDVDDVYQETILRAFGGIGRFEWRGEESFMAWLAGIAANVIDSLARRRALDRRARITAEIPVEVLSPSKAIRREERFDRLQDSIAKLSAEHREVISLIRLKGLSFAEAASRMGRSPDAVRQLLYRALRQLRSTFGDTESLHLPQRRLGDPGGRDGP